jgi:Protein of unknown function (DUF3168)
MFPEGLVTFLAADPGTSGVLGASRTDKTNGIFPSIAIKEVTMPYIVYVQVSARPVTSFAGANRFTYGRWRLTCYGASYKSAKTLAENVKKALNGFQGMWSDGTYVGSCFLLSEADTSEPVPHGTVFGVPLDFEFWFNDAS